MKKLKRRVYLPYCLLMLVLCTGSSLGAGPAPLTKWPCDCEPERELLLRTPPLSGEDVRGLQSYLNKLGLDAGPKDGIYGPLTARAVKEFQRRVRIVANGVVDQSTWAALGTMPAGRKPAASPHPIVLIVDLRLALLIVLSHGKVAATYPVAVGRPGKPTPVGNFRIIRKAEWGEGFGTRWLGLNVPWGTYGIHGTNRPWTIGGYESAGCIRMFNTDVEQLYDQVAVGTAVHIIGDPFYATEELGPGDTGAPVLYLQRRLRQLGYLNFAPDGAYGLSTEKAVMSFQKAKGLEVTGIVTWLELEALRLRPID